MKRGMGVNARSYVPQDQLYLWALVNPAQPTLVGELRLSQLVADCATFRYGEGWWHFPLSEDLPLLAGQEFTAGERSSAPGAIDDARPDRWGERIIRHVDRPARLSILEMLLFAGDDRFGALGVSVSADRYVPRALGPYPQVRDLAQLSAAMEDLQTQAPVTAEMQRLIQPGVTLGGARPKALLQTDAGPCVIKFSELDDAVDTPLVEHATMTLAAQAGIRPRSRPAGSCGRFGATRDEDKIPGPRGGRGLPGGGRSGHHVRGPRRRVRPRVPRRARRVDRRPPVAHGPGRRPPAAHHRCRPPRGAGPCRAGPAAAGSRRRALERRQASPTGARPVAQPTSSRNTRWAAATTHSFT